MYQDLSIRHAMQYDWPVEKAISIVDLPIKMNGNSKHTSGNSLSQLPGVEGGGGVLPYMGYIGMCCCEGYGFQAVYSRIGYINQSVWV